MAVPFWGETPKNSANTFEFYYQKGAGERLDVTHAAHSVRFTVHTTSRTLDDCSPSSDRRRKRAHVRAEEAGQHLDDQIRTTQERSSRGALQRRTSGTSLARHHQRHQVPNPRETHGAPSDFRPKCLSLALTQTDGVSSNKTKHESSKPLPVLITGTRSTSNIKETGCWKNRETRPKGKPEKENGEMRKKTEQEKCHNYFHHGDTNSEKKRWPDSRASAGKVLSGACSTWSRWSSSQR